MTTPYTYLIGWKHLDTWYYGVRYAEGCNPIDLWVNYKTSSKCVTEFVKLHGEPDIVTIRRIFTNKLTAKIWEDTVLRRMNVCKDVRFLNQTDSSFKGIIMTPEIKLKISITSKSLETQNKKRETMLRSYGVESYAYTEAAIERMSGKNNPGKTKKSRDSARNRMLSDDNPGVYTEEAINKRRTSKKESDSKLTDIERLSKYGRLGEKNGFYGKQHSPELLEHIKNAICKFTYILTSPNGEVFTTNSLNEFSKTLGIDRSVLMRYINTDVKVPKARKDAGKTRINSTGWKIRQIPRGACELHI